MIEIEPRLQGVITHAESLNHTERYWSDAWIILKREMNPFIGFLADDNVDERLCTHESWDAFHDHLSRICNKCR